MDSDILKIEEIVMGGGETIHSADVNTEDAGKPYTTVIIQDPSPPPVIQACKNASVCSQEA